jgi:glycosyltransferase involved in cell wall biosynthesis
MYLFTVTICLLAAYGVLMALYTRGHWNLRAFVAKGKTPQTKFSIVIPARNEAANIEACIAGILAQNYPTHLFEVIVIDDFSNDNSEKIFNNWRMENGLIQTTLLENLRLSNSPKKDAISRAVPVVKNEWIITTDADCEVPRNWLLAFDNYIQIIDGSAEITISDKVFNLKLGEGIVIPANAKHSFNANEQFKMISTIIKSGYED